MALLEKLGLVPQRKFDELVDVVGKAVDIIAQLTGRLLQLEERVKASQQPGTPSLLDCGLCGKRHAEVPCPNVPSKELLEIVDILNQKKPCCGGECNKHCVDGNPYSHADHLEDEMECDGRPCTCGSTDQEFEEHVREETEPVPWEINAEEQLRRAEEGDDGTWPAQREVARQCRESVQDTGTVLEDWMMDAVQKAVLERLKDFVGQKLSPETMHLATLAAQQEVDDMRRRFGVTRRYLAEILVDGPDGQLTVQIREAK